MFFAENDVDIVSESMNFLTDSEIKSDKSGIYCNLKLKVLQFLPL